MSTSVSSVVNHFPSAENGFTTTTSGSVSSGAATVGLNSVAGYTNGETVVFVIDPTDASKKQTFTGTMDTSGLQVTGVVWTAGTNQAHASGATVVDYATATHISMVTKGILVDHLQSGAHKFATVYDPNNTTLETLKLAGLSSAVNEITITNATTGNFPTISATGEADTGIDFENSEGEEILKLDAVASAVNEVTIKNAVTTAAPSIEASGSDTNIDLKLTPKGTGRVVLNGAGAPATASVATSQTTTSTSATDLATVGPSVTVTIGSSGMALVCVGCDLFNSTTSYSLAGVVISGANTVAYTDYVLVNGTNEMNFGKSVLLTGLTAGSTTFKMQYRVLGGTGTFSSRQIAVIPL